MLKLSKNEVDEEVVKAFNEFFLSIPDADETLLETNDDGEYESDFVKSLFFTFNKGFRSCLISMIAKAEFGLNIKE